MSIKIGEVVTNKNVTVTERWSVEINGAPEVAKRYSSNARRFTPDRLLVIREDTNGSVRAKAHLNGPGVTKNGPGARGSQDYTWNYDLPEWVPDIAAQAGVPADVVALLRELVREVRP